MRNVSPEGLVAGTLTLGLAVCIVLPVAWIVLATCLPADLLGLGTSAGSPRQAPGVLEPFAYLLRHYGAWIAFSGRTAVAVVLLGIVTAVPAGYVFARFPFPGSRVLEELALLPLSLPGIALSVALLAAYPTLRGSLLVLGGHLLYTLPFYVRVTTNALRAQDIAQLEDAARTLGAGLLDRLRWIVLPQLRHAVLLGALLVFTVSWGEFNVSYLLNSGQPQTFPSALYNTYANEGLDRASAATLVFLAGLLPALALIQLLDDGRGARAEQGS